MTTSQASPNAFSAVSWLQGIFGPYLWPQLTVTSRAEGRGGTEFPMLIMNASPSEGLVMHEATHQWLHGILANNEWREGWLDEGFTSFMTNWYWEEKGQTEVWNGTMEGLARLQRVDSIEPVARNASGIGAQANIEACGTGISQPARRICSFCRNRYRGSSSDVGGPGW